MKTPISYYGGKQTMLRHILPMVPQHRLYTEAFVGGGALYFAKEPSEVEVINDINENLVCFYRVLKSNYEKLNAKIEETLHARDVHRFANIVYTFPHFFDEITRAWAVWVLSKQSYASKLDGTWGYDKAENTMSKKITNAKDAFTEEISKRLEQTQIECTDALKIIRSRDMKEAFHFVDPPYFNSDCGHYKGYTINDFIDLLNILETIEGKFLLTMYSHDVLMERITKNKWNYITVERTISASKTNRRKQEELIVFNYNLKGI